MFVDVQKNDGLYILPNVTLEENVNPSLTIRLFSKCEPNQLVIRGAKIDGIFPELCRPK
jgi:hypothetical protein